ncbi:MAG: DUF2949 domain-containing protein [Tildeniella torsiva UHER 1998/13D]|nr:DUF2949 domain-containing protein [Tildeniella torsiva UHER 1998/13D]
MLSRLVSFVQTEFGVSNEEVATAFHHHDSATQLPMILWQYGFITTAQLDTLFAWLERARFRSIKGGRAMRDGLGS